MLALEPIQAGSPQVLAGRAGLTNPVRWVHVADSPSAPRFLEGGELVLTTGAEWPDGADLVALTEELLDAGSVAVMVEPGTRFDEASAEIQQVCEHRGVPFIVLRHAVHSVTITRAVHRRLVASQMATLEASDTVHALFTELTRAGAPADHIVSEVARLIGSPVVLEDLAHRVVTHALLGRSEADVLEDWARRSRSCRDSTRGCEVDVVARGRRCGRLVAVDVDPDAPGTDLVLSLGALALCLDATAGVTVGHPTWDALRQQRIVEMLLRRRYTSGADLLRGLESAGLPVPDAPTVAIGWVVSRDGGTDRPGWIDHTRGIATRVTGLLHSQVVCTPIPAVPGGMLGLLVLPPGTDEVRADRLLGEVDDRIRHADLPLDLTVAGRLVLPTGRDIDQLQGSIRDACDLLETARRGTGQLLRPRGNEIDQLTRMVPPLLLQEFVEELIGPLLTYDARHGTDLVSVLETYLRHPGNRTLAARESHLSRSVFYQRLELMESQLGRDLHDGSTLAALHVAISARRGATGHR